MAETTEYSDCKGIVGLRASAGVEIVNFHTSLVSIIDAMAVINADQPRRAKFDTMYGKIDDSYVPNDFDDFLIFITTLKTHLEDEGWIPE